MTTVTRNKFTYSVIINGLFYNVLSLFIYKEKNNIDVKNAECNEYFCMSFKISSDV